MLMIFAKCAVATGSGTIDVFTYDHVAILRLERRTIDTRWLIINYTSIVGIGNDREGVNEKILISKLELCRRNSTGLSTDGYTHTHVNYFDFNINLYPSFERMSQWSL